MRMTMLQHSCQTQNERPRLPLGNGTITCAEASVPALPPGARTGGVPKGKGVSTHGLLGRRS